MQINKLEVINFRGFEKREFFLNPHFTVAIGNNGTGKSTLLHAMQVAVGAFFLGFKGVYQRYIQEDEIRISFNPISKQWVYHTPTVVKATGFINGSGEFSWQRVISEHGASTSSKAADIGSIRGLAESYAKSIDTPDRPMLPLIANFGVRQLGGRSKRQQRTKNKRMIVRDGYYNALGSKSDDSSYREWLYYYEENLSKEMEFEGTREAVFQAIEKAIPYLSKVGFDRYLQQLEADCSFSGQSEKRLRYELMSDGLKRLLGIVTDIAYRCVILNGHRGARAVEETHGVVLIDELDMHLHPNWQRHVIADLKRGFPMLQFIATTHSPFIVQSLQSDELINLDLPGDVNPQQLKIDEIAIHLMGVDSPFSEENADKHNKAKDILDALNRGTLSAQLADEIDNIADPGLRAFLQLNKSAKDKAK